MPWRMVLNDNSAIDLENPRVYLSAAWRRQLRRGSNNTTYTIDGNGSPVPSTQRATTTVKTRGIPALSSGIELLETQARDAKELRLDNEAGTPLLTVPVAKLLQSNPRAAGLQGYDLDLVWLATAAPTAGGTIVLGTETFDGFTADGQITDAPADLDWTQRGSTNADVLAREEAFVAGNGTWCGVYAAVNTRSEAHHTADIADATADVSISAYMRHRAATGFTGVSNVGFVLRDQTAAPTGALTDGILIQVQRTSSSLITFRIVERIASVDTTLDEVAAIGMNMTQRWQLTASIDGTAITAQMIGLDNVVNQTLTGTASLTGPGRHGLWHDMTNNAFSYVLVDTIAINSL